VFTGADGSFDYYEDDGVSYGYERGEFARIPLRYDAAKGTLTIGRAPAATRACPKNARSRCAGSRTARRRRGLDARGRCDIEYKGAEVTVGRERKR
jgi:alpha-D-xyloside xylohydrolase